MDPNIVHMSLRSFQNHEISKTSLPVQSSLSKEFVKRTVPKIKKPLKKSREDDSGPYLPMLALRTTKKQLWYICPRVTDEKKVVNTSAFTTCKRKHPNETQETNSQPIQRTSTTEYKQQVLLLPE